MARRTRHAYRIMANLVCAAVLAAGPAAINVAGQTPLTVKVDSLRPGGVILGAYAYCVPAKVGHSAGGPNRSPAISWSKGPAGTASYAIITVDTDVPTVFDSANKEGQVIPATLKRRDFYHWVLVDIPPTVTGLPVAADSTRRIPEGKPVGPTPNGLRGANDFGRPGTHGGYDGPCPPWNDAIVHHYHFQVYALNVAHLGLSGGFSGLDAMKAMQGHILAMGEVVGLYTQNPDVARQIGIK